MPDKLARKTSSFLFRSRAGREKKTTGLFVLKEKKKLCWANWVEGIYFLLFLRLRVRVVSYLGLSSLENWPFPGTRLLPCFDWPDNERQCAPRLLKRNISRFYCPVLCPGGFLRTVALFKIRLFDSSQSFHRYFALFFLNYHVGCLLDRVFSEDVCCKEIVPGVRINILLGSIWFSCWFFFTLIFFFLVGRLRSENGLKRFSRDKCHLAPVIFTTKAGISNVPSNWSAIFLWIFGVPKLSI